MGMRRNRKVRKNSRVASGSFAVVSLVVMGFIMLMVCCNLKARCESISMDIGKAERELAGLERECGLEMARWDEMKAPEKLANCLLRSGLDMRYPTPAQVVRMAKSGRPAPGQYSVAQIRQQRLQVSSLAQYQSEPQKRSKKVRR